MFIAFPGDLARGKHVVVAGHAKADAAVFFIGDFGVGNGIVVEVNDVVQRTHGAGDDVLDFVFVFHVNAPKIQAGKIADDKIAGFVRGDDNGFAVFGFNGAALQLCRGHVLGDFRAEVGAVNDAAFRVGIHAVDGVAVKGEWGAGFNDGFEDEPHQFFQLDFALQNAVVLDAVLIARFPFLAPIVFQRISLDREHVVRVKQVPALVDVFFHHFPEKVGVAHGGEHVVRFEAVVAVVGANLQKFGQILVPGVEVDGDRALPHAQLVHGDSGVVDDFYPADNAACGAFKAANGAAGGADFAKIHAHAAAKFADLGEAVDAVVNAFERVGDGVHKTTGKLVIGLARVGQRGRGHGDFLQRKHVVKTAHPFNSAVFFLHGQMQGDAKIHFLRRFQRGVVAVADDVARQEQVQPGVGVNLVSVFLDELRAAQDFIAAVVFEDVGAVQPFIHEIFDFVVEVVDAAFFLFPAQIQAELVVEQAGGNHFPARVFVAGQLDSGLDEGVQLLGRRHVFFFERLVLGVKAREVVAFFRKIPLNVHQAGFDFRNVQGFGQVQARDAQLRAALPVQDVVFGDAVMTAFHERLFHAVLDFLNLRLLLMFQQRLHALEDFLQLLCGDGHPVAVKGFLHGGGDFAGLVFLVFSVAFFDGGAHLVFRGGIVFASCAAARWFKKAGASKKTRQAAVFPAAFSRGRRWLWLASCEGLAASPLVRADYACAPV